MTSISLLKRALINALFIFFITSCSPSTHAWQKETITSCVIVYLPPVNHFKNLKIEIQKHAQETLIYLTIYSSPLVCDPDGSVPMLLTINGHKALYQAPLLAGGYRALLPPDATQAVLSALESHAEMTISIGKYTTDVHYEGFEKSLNAADFFRAGNLRNPSPINPCIHLFGLLTF
jgi:hypothetical protein